MAVPEYLTDQNENYIKSRGYTFKDFSPEQILDQLKLVDIRYCLHGRKSLNEKYKDSEGKLVAYSTIVDGIFKGKLSPKIGNKSRWAILKNPYSRNLYKCVRNKQK